MSSLVLEFEVAWYRTKKLPAGWRRSVSQPYNRVGGVTDLSKEYSRAGACR